MPGHNPFAFVNGKLQPTVAGVYDNVIRDNHVTGNGTQGFGAGVLLAVPFPGSASYNNLIEDNLMAGNGLAGVTMHDHLPGGAYMNGNRIVDNEIDRNNLLGDTFDTNPPAPDKVTTGIIVYSGADRVTIKISDNEISNNSIGVWLTTNVTAPNLSTGNEFHHVTTPVSANPPM